MKHYLIHYGEIALKFRNRPFFEKALMENISGCVKHIAPCRLHRLQGRFWLEFPAAPDTKKVSDALGKIFGLANFIPCGVAGASLEELKRNLARELEQEKFSSFAVRAKRADKTFPVSSQYVNEEIGRFVQEKTKAAVNLTHPETTIHIELFENRIFYGFRKIPGPGGLPVGVSGRVMALLSGGIDSPVAAWRMMKRGCEVSFVHFHSAPFASAQSEDKVLELAEILNGYQKGGILISVPFGEIQRQIVADAPEALRILLYRRMMLRIASLLAGQEGCLALVTGEALAQVASQTLPNLASVESAASLPVLRPLIGMDKQEIVEQAQKIGTFPVSIRPHDDCCTFMTPKSPRTRSTAGELERIEAKWEVEEWVQKGVLEGKRYRLEAT